MSKRKRTSEIEQWIKQGRGTGIAVRREVKRDKMISLWILSEIILIDDFKVESKGMMSRWSTSWI